MKIQLQQISPIADSPSDQLPLYFFLFFLVYFIFYEETAKKGKEKKSRFFFKLYQFLST